MMSNQDFVKVTASDLLGTVQDLKTDGWRLGQACATKVEDGIDLLYSFDKEHVLKNLKLHIKDNEAVQSVTHIYWAAFIYENEMQDLFGVEFNNLALNYGGHFFKTSETTPWNPDSEFAKKQEAKEAAEAKAIENAKAAEVAEAQKAAETETNDKTETKEEVKEDE